MTGRRRIIKGETVKDLATTIGALSSGPGELAEILLCEASGSGFRSSMGDVLMRVVVITSLAVTFI